MNILVTGGSGFIGTNLVSELLSDGHNVQIFDKRTSSVYPDNCITADIRDKEKLIDALNGIDAVYHLAAEHHDNVEPASLYYDVNVGGAKNLIQALEKNRIKKLFFTSSVAIYGLEAKNPNEDTPVKPFNDYGNSKYEAEKLFDRWADQNQENALVIVRPTVIFGEGNRGNVYNLIRQISAGKFIMIGKGKNKKSMGYVLNIARFLKQLIDIDPGRYVYNYADKPDLDMNQLVTISLNTLGKKSAKIFRIPYFVGLTGGYFFDFLSTITEQKYSISSIRVKKFCADTVVDSERLSETGFNAPYQLIDGLNNMIISEFSHRFETSEHF